MAEQSDQNKKIFTHIFWWKKLAFFLTTNIMIKFFQNLALFQVKNANFLPKIGKIAENCGHNIDPCGHTEWRPNWWRQSARNGIFIGLQAIYNKML
jgi:hypothetical protein